MGVPTLTILFLISSAFGIAKSAAEIELYDYHRRDVAPFCSLISVTTYLNTSMMTNDIPYTSYITNSAVTVALTVSAMD